MPRKKFDGGRLADDVARLTAADKISPPEARPSLMEAVRQFSGFIEARAKLDWPNPAIAAVLTEAGYPINAATLRSYRSRLRDEILAADAPSDVPTGGNLIEDPPTVGKRQPATSISTGKQGGVATPSADRVQTHAIQRAPPRDLPAGASPAGRTFRLDRTKLSPDRA